MLDFGVLREKDSAQNDKMFVEHVQHVARVSDPGLIIVLLLQQARVHDHPFINQGHPTMVCSKIR